MTFFIIQYKTDLNCCMVRCEIRRNGLRYTGCQVIRGKLF